MNPHVKANYLASPPLVVAYALAGTTDINLAKEPLGQDSGGGDVFLKDIWLHDLKLFLQKTAIMFLSNRISHKSTLNGRKHSSEEKR